ATGDPIALVTPLRVAERRVENRHLIAEPLPEPAHRLWRERDLRDEHDRAEAAVEGLAAGLEVHLCLAAAGGTFEKDVLADALVEGRDDSRYRRLLRLGQGRGLGLALEGLTDPRRVTLPSRLAP